jgi:PAS domain S-box-containing protein
MAEADVRGILFESVHQRRDGSTFPVEVSSRGVAADGTHTLISVVRDITERKRTEEALRESDQRLLTAFATTPDAISITRLRDGAYVALNRSFEQISLWPREEVLGKTVFDVNFWVDWEERERLMALLQAKGRIENAEAAIRRRDGTVLTVSIAAQLFEVNGERYLLAVTRDISNLKRTELALREADRQKDQFLAMLSHELRNPLAPIRNSLYILDRAAPGGEQAMRAKAILHRQVGQLTWLIDDLLDVTRIAHGKVQLQRERIDLNELVHRAAEDQRAGFVKCEVRLEVLPAPAEVWVNGDRVRLTQVIGNLLQNAVKFTPRGGTTTLAVESDATRRQAIVTVRDSGRGIAPELLPQLFQAFVQADATLDRSKGGLGLGLALVKGLVELHGGSVSAASDGPGQGATFTILLPVEVYATQALRDCGAGEATVPRRVLVIEDNQDAADSLRDVLEFEQHRVEVAYSGRDGLEKARAFHPDVVLCDIGLPGMDGYAVARAMRADPELGHVGLVAVSGYTQADDVAIATEAGFDAHLAKPPSFEKLKLVLEEVGELRRRRAGASPPMS